MESFIEQNEGISKCNELLVQIFSGILDQVLLLDITNKILEVLPNAKIIGSTTDGEIIEDEVHTNSIVISFTTFKKSKTKISIIKDVNKKQSNQAGISIANNLVQDDTKVMILFGDGLNINGEEFLNGVQNSVKDIVISGGLAGDNATFSETFVICQNEIISHAVVGVSISSKELKVNHGYSFAWQNIGRKFKVNKSEKGRVYEVDGMTPVELYAKYLGQEVADLLPGIGIEFPLIIQDGNIDIARAVLEKSDDGSLVFAGSIEEDSIVRFGVGNSNELLTDAYNLAVEVGNKDSQNIFIYSCMARRRFLGSQASEDIKNFTKISNVSGFFTYGEFFTINNEYKLLNETLTVLSMSEESNTTNNINFIDEVNNVSQVTTLQALSHLVNVSSNELEMLNGNLEDRITTEIEKNIENEKKIFDSMKMSSLGDMIANIAHQWRQPLSVITTCASSMQIQQELGILDEEIIIKNTKSMIYQAEYLSDTINTFRDFIKEDYVLDNIILEKDIKKTLKLLDVVLKDNMIELVDEIDYEKSTILRLISGELSQVIINIFNNAKDALIENKIMDKWIKLSVNFTGDNCIITIEDNAGGIPADVLPKIFEPYFTTKHQTTGTGIGLYMSYDIVTKHFAGNLYARNTQNGAKFYIEIPKPKE